MSLDSINSATSPFVTTLRAEDTEVVAGSSAAREKLADSFDEFMLLFTTQLQNQDPTEPLDTNQMTEQLVQFTGVEQAVETNSLLEELLAQSSTSQADSAVSYIGRYVETDGNQGILANGIARFSYDIPAGAQTATLTVLDSVGRPVATNTIEATAGEYAYQWDGINTFDGTQMNDGIYQFGLAVRDINGELIDATTYTSGVVTGVELSGATPVMTLDGQIKVDSDRINSVVGIFGDQTDEAS